MCADDNYVGGPSYNEGRGRKVVKKKVIIKPAPPIPPDRSDNRSSKKDEIKELKREVKKLKKTVNLLVKALSTGNTDNLK